MQYFFECNCIACKQNWPQVTELRKTPDELICANCNFTLRAPAEKKRCERCKKISLGTGKLIQLTKTIPSYVQGIIQEKDNLDDPHKIAATIAKTTILIQEMERRIRMPSWNFTLLQQLLCHCYSLPVSTNRQPQ